MKYHVAIIPLILLLAWGVQSCSKSKPDASHGASRVEVASPVIDSVTIYKSYPGRLSANREVDIVARVDGTLESKEFEGGAFVKKGSVLFRIEDRNYRDNAVQAEAALATAQANRDYAAARYAAMTEAIKSDAVSRMEVEQARSNYEQSEASLKNATAALRTARTQLSYCTVTAPFDGHISINDLSVGTFVAGAAAPVKLASIYEDNTMLADFSIDDSSVGQLVDNIKSGKVDLKNIPLDFGTEVTHIYTADLDYLAPKVNPSTGTLALQAVIDNPYGELRSGMYLSVKLPVANDSHALLIRDSSIASDQLGKYVYVVNDSNRVVYTPIETGDLVADSLRIVTKGLAPSDKYVTKALLKVRDGMTVDPIVK